jgi:hypothetical protein
MTTPSAPPLTTPVVLVRRKECPMCGNAWETTEALAADRDRLARENAELRKERDEAIHGECDRAVERDAARAEVEKLRAALDERNTFTALRVVGELEKHGLVKGDKYDAAAARIATLEAVIRKWRSLPTDVDWGTPRGLEKLQQSEREADAALAGGGA